MIINEYLKAAGDQVLDVFVKLFNVILQSGEVPTQWCIGEIIPLYKNKGSPEDPSNYRGITILSCFGKLFTSVLNTRLSSFLESQRKLGQEQTGFRCGYSTNYHVFTLHCILNFFLNKRKRLFCAFIDYEKAFDKVKRAFLWEKMLHSGVSNNFLKVVKNMYSKAKSCVKVNNSYSGYFPSVCGVRQGENLSPLLFALFLNDLKSFLLQKDIGLYTMSREASMANMDITDVNALFQMFLLLYADDTVICAESEAGLQGLLDGMYEYCIRWQLQINISKTKIIVFSRGKIRNMPIFLFNGEPIEVVFDVMYLGLKLNYNNKFSVAMKNLYDRASRAMFLLLRKCRKLSLPVDIQVDLFDKMVVPILLYGSEVWGFGSCELATKLQLRFYKTVFKLRKSTPNAMVFGELGKIPVEINAKVRLLCYWYKLVNPENRNNFSSIAYWFSYKMFLLNLMDSEYLSTIKTILNNLGLSEFWISQGNFSFSAPWFKEKVERCLFDQCI